MSHMTKEPGHPDTCPLCHSALIEWLRRMRKHDHSQDWFRCETCDHFFTVERTQRSNDGFAVNY